MPATIAVANTGPFAVVISVVFCTVELLGVWDLVKMLKMFSGNRTTLLACAVLFVIFFSVILTMVGVLLVVLI